MKPAGFAGDTARRPPKMSRRRRDLRMMVAALVVVAVTALAPHQAGAVSGSSSSSPSATGTSPAPSPQTLVAGKGYVRRGDGTGGIQPVTAVVLVGTLLGLVGACAAAGSCRACVARRREVRRLRAGLDELEAVVACWREVLSHDGDDVGERRGA